MKLSEVKDVGKYYRIEFDGAVEKAKKFSSDAEAIAWFDKFVADIDDDEAEVGTLGLFDETGDQLKSKSIY